MSRQSGRGGSDAGGNPDSYPYSGAARASNLTAPSYMGTYTTSSYPTSYQQAPSPSEGYGNYQSIPAQGLPVYPQDSPPQSYAQNVGSAYQQQGDSGYQQQVASSYQQPAASRYQQQVASSYYQQPVASGYQQPAASGYQQQVASGYQQQAASGYQPQATPLYTHSTSFPPSPPSTGDDPPFTLVPPSREGYYRRQNRRAQDTARMPQQLQYGWPVRFDGQSTWTKEDLADPQNQAGWVYIFTPSDRKILDDALRLFRDSGRDLLYISPSQFIIADPLGSKLKEIGSRLYDDRGFFLLRGLDLSLYDDREKVILHAGISSYVGSQRAYQCENDNVVAHIKDCSRFGGIGSDLAPTSTSNEIGFHTDIGDIISNLTIDPAAQGGMSYFASTAQVYNDLARTRPDIINLLAQPWQFDIFPNDPAGDKPLTYRPLLYNSGTHPTLICFRRPFVATPPYNRRQGNFFPISSAQKEALDAIHFTASNTALPIMFQRGDISFTNNLRVLHARQAFQDHPNMPQRHVQRLIVRDPSQIHRLPAGLGDIWQKIYGDPNQPWKNEAFRPEATMGEPLWKLNG